MSFLKYQKSSPDFLNNYLKYKRFIEFYSNTTIDGVYFDLRTFFRYLKLKLYNTKLLENFDINDFKKVNIKDITIKDINNINRNMIIEFTYFLSEKLNNDTVTSNRKLASIKKLFEYLFSNNLIDNNPCINLETGRIEKRLPKYLTLKESKKLLSIAIKSKMKYKIRNYCITCLFLNCGLRLSELTKINLSDIKFDEHTLKIHGKGNKDRILYLDEACSEAISEYIKERPKLDKSYIDYNALFLSSRNKRISTRNVQTIIKDELKMAFNDTKNDIHTHSLRHTTASLMYNISNTDILILKKMLGHSSLSSTEIYTHVSSQKMKEIMNNCTISSILEKKKEELLNERK